ncbi:MAG: hypothetical protein E7576_03805 [Ruminococcaceae bacterium]|nr:hypothetical protein [Oscillospiraceae bacterium]
MEKSAVIIVGSRRDGTLHRADGGFPVVFHQGNKGDVKPLLHGLIPAEHRVVQGFSRFLLDADLLGMRHRAEGIAVVFDVREIVRKSGFSVSGISAASFPAASGDGAVVSPDGSAAVSEQDASIAAERSRQITRFITSSDRYDF